MSELLQMYVHKQLQTARTHFGCIYLYHKKCNFRCYIP